MRILSRIIRKKKSPTKPRKRSTGKNKLKIKQTDKQAQEIELSENKLLENIEPEEKIILRGLTDKENENLNGILERYQQRKITTYKRTLQ